VHYFNKIGTTFTKIGSQTSGTGNAIKTGTIVAKPVLPAANTAISIQNYNIPRAGETTRVKLKFTAPTGTTTALTFSAYDFEATNLLYAANTDGNVLCFTEPNGGSLRTMHSNCKHGGANTPNVYTMTLTNTIAATTVSWLTITTRNPTVLKMPLTYHPNYATFTTTTGSAVENPILYASPPKPFKTLIIE
jgi:hypothetical protein